MKFIFKFCQRFTFHPVAWIECSRFSCLALGDGVCIKGRGSRFYNFPRLSHIVVVIHLVSFYVPLIRKFWMQFVSLKTWKINNRAVLADDVIWAVMTSRCRRDLYRRANKWRHISQLTFARWHFRVFRIILTPYLFSQPRLGLKINYFTINIIYV